MSQAYRESLWLFAVTQALHLVAVSAFIGAILIVDLRLLGRGSDRQSHAEIARSAQRVLLWAGPAVLVTGIPQFTTNALRYYASPVFAFKMGLLAAALIFTVTLRRRVAGAGGDRLPAWMPRAVAAVSIALWMGVAISGRWIGFSE
jgi:hypothetical protein